MIGKRLIPLATAVPIIRAIHLFLGPDKKEEEKEKKRRIINAIWIFYEAMAALFFFFYFVLFFSVRFVWVFFFA